MIRVSHGTGGACSPLRQSREALQVGRRLFSPDMFFANGIQHVNGASVGPIEIARYRGEALRIRTQYAKALRNLFIQPDLVLASSTLDVPLYLLFKNCYSFLWVSPSCVSICNLNLECSACCDASTSIRGYDIMARIGRSLSSQTQ